MLHERHHHHDDRARVRALMALVDQLQSANPELAQDAVVLEHENEQLRARLAALAPVGRRS